ncbi:MAG: pyridoxal-dependent decarboxylase [Pirellulaceae bacterium]
MTAPYRKILDSLRQAFPQPASDPVHDAYFVLSISRALDQVDSLKQEDAPILGKPVELDWDAARRERMPHDTRSLEHVIPDLVSYLEGMVMWGHPRSQVNVVSLPSIASIIGVLLPSVYNPNLCSEETSRRLAEAEVRAAAMSADLVGYDPLESAGVFTFGGTSGMLYGVKTGLEKAVPDCMRRGLREPAVILCSDESHYCAHTVAGWLGLGEEQLVLIPTHDDNSMQIDRLEEAARRVLADGKKIAAIVATMGTTDAFGIDDLEAIHQVRERLVEEFELPYRPHIHADAVIGWAWAAFNDYDFKQNELGFRGRTIRALAEAAYRIRHLPLSDSLGIDFHKTGFAPYISSLVLFRDRHDLAKLTRRRESMPYLFQSGEYHPGKFTLETSRGGGGPLAALANLLLFGKQGLRTLLGHIVEMAEVLRESLESRPEFTVLNGDNVGPVTLFRIYPPGVDTFRAPKEERTDPEQRELLLAYNEYNRRIYQRVHAEALAGRGVAISQTDCYRQTAYGEPIVALKSYVLSPFSDEHEMHAVVDHILAARDVLESEGGLESCRAAK